MSHRSRDSGIIPSPLVAVAWAACIACASCAADNYAQLYASANIAPSVEPTAVKNLEHLGATVVDDGANFGVYSEHATRIDLLLFDDPEAAQPTRQFQMTRFGAVWNVYVEGIGVGQHYGYVAWGPNWPEDDAWFPGSIHGFIEDVDLRGNRFNPNKLLIDPYARALHRDFDWSKGSAASGHHRTVSSYAAAPKGIIIASKYQWSDNETQWQQQRKDRNWRGHRWNDLIIYEVHPKGFTAGAGPEIERPGTFRAFGEMAGYLADLGITAVEMMPPFEKPAGNDGTYWGYNTLNYFSPENSLCWKQDREQCADEFKGMVDQLHQSGIEIIVDVVFNHTGELGLWRDRNELFPGEFFNIEPEEVANLFSFRGLDNPSYYALSNNNRSYLEATEDFRATGVGNQTRCNHTPMRKLIMDSLHYWVEEMHVDGFRFDLAPVLGAPSNEPKAWADPISNTVVQEIIDDPLFLANNTRIIAEPWSLHQFRLGDFPSSTVDPSVGWLEWNGHFRDVWRAFVNWDTRALNSAEGPVDLGGALTGSEAKFGDDGRKPFASVNFVTVHDGFTMYDLVSYNEKHNLCGVLNPVCCIDDYSLIWCDPNSGEDNNRSRDWSCASHGQADCESGALPTCYWHCEWGNCTCRSDHRENASAENLQHQNLTDNEPFKRQMMRNLFTALMISHGTPMFRAGDEWMRTQFGNNNAYQFSADNRWNWLQWGTWRPRPERRRMHDFVRKLIQFRKDHDYALAPSEYGGGAPFSWKNAANNPMQASDWGNRHIMIHYYDQSFGPELLILINMEGRQVDFTLPTGRTWRRIIDTQHFFDREEEFAPTRDPFLSANITVDAPETITGTSYGVYTRSIVVCQALNN